MPLARFDLGPTDAVGHHAPFDRDPPEDQEQARPQQEGAPPAGCSGTRPWRIAIGHEVHGRTRDRKSPDVDGMDDRPREGHARSLAGVVPVTYWTLGQSPCRPRRDCLLRSIPCAARAAAVSVTAVGSGTTITPKRRE